MAANADRRLGRILFERQLITSEKLQEALEAQRVLKDKGTRRRLGAILVEKKACTVAHVRLALSIQGKTVLYCKFCKKAYNIVNYAPPAPAACSHCGTMLQVPGESTIDAAGTTILPVAAPVKAEGRKLAGEPFGRYRLLEQLGKGAAGSVYKAWDPEAMRNVALRKFEGIDAGTRERLLRGARAAAPLKHSHIVAIHEVGTEGKQPYVAMALVEGKTFRDYLTLHAPEGLSCLKEEIGILVQVIDALGAAHAQGIVHGNLKPANILLDQEDEVFVSDLGMAGGEGPAADFRAVGAILYEVLTGQPPAQPPAPPRSLRKEIPESLEAVCMKCLEADPKRGYGNAKELADDIKGYLAPRPTAAKPVPAPPVAAPVAAPTEPATVPVPEKRRRLPLAIAGVVLMGVAIAAAVVIPSVRRRSRMAGNGAAARLAYEEGRYDDAIRAWRLVLHDESGNLDAVKGIAAAEEDIARKDAKRKVAELESEAARLADQLKFDAAISKLREAIAVCGKHAGQLQGQKGYLEQSIRDLERRKEEESSSSEWESLQREFKEGKYVVSEMLDKSKRTRENHRTLKRPWTLPEGTSEIDKMVQTLERQREEEIAAQKRELYQSVRHEIVQKFKLNHKGEEDFAGALREWQAYLDRTKDNEGKLKAPSEMLRVRFSAYEASREFLRKVGGMKKADAIKALEAALPRFVGVTHDTGEKIVDIEKELREKLKELRR